MNKAEMIKKVAGRIEDMTKNQVDEVFKVYAEVVEECMRTGEKVVLPGIGTFAVKEVPEKRGKIQFGDRKGEEYVTPAHKEPKFTMPKSYRDMLK